ADAPPPPPPPPAVPLEFAGQKASGERTPHEQTEALILEHRDHFALEFATSQRVERLRAAESLELLLARNRQRFHQLPRGKIRTTDVSHLAGTHQVVEGPQGIFERRQRIESMDLIEIDVVRR